MDALTYLSTRVAIFDGVAEADLAPLAAAAELMDCPAGQTILFKGATVDGLHVVCGGSVTVHAKVPNKGLVQVATLGEGEAFGETSIVEHGTATATVKAGPDGARLLIVAQEAFRHLLQLDEAFAVRVNTLIRSRKASEPATPA
ncbi:MAG: cyclic nucleotide-binding domain-containing protein [Elusimicrobiota bacterium]|nr:cyclic nucleotide-binding domain-containing protein [Elusimicrobiota bacterium]